MNPPELEIAVAELEDRVERLRALYEQYFLGFEKIEPQVLRKDVDRRLHVLRREQIRNTGLRFKLQQVISRYNTFGMYWQRILREIENGTYKRDVARAAKRFGTEAMTTAAKRRLGRRGLAEAKEAEEARARAAQPPPEDATSPFQRADLPALEQDMSATIPGVAPPAMGSIPPVARPPSRPRAPQVKLDLDEDDELFAGLDLEAGSAAAPPPIPSPPPARAAMVSRPNMAPPPPPPPPRASAPSTPRAVPMGVPRPPSSRDAAGESPVVAKPPIAPSPLSSATPPSPVTKAPAAPTAPAATGAKPPVAPAAPVVATAKAPTPPAVPAKPGAFVPKAPPPAAPLDKPPPRPAVVAPPAATPSGSAPIPPSAPGSQPRPQVVVRSGLAASSSFGGSAPLRSGLASSGTTSPGGPPAPRASAPIPAKAPSPEAKAQAPRAAAAPLPDLSDGRIKELYGKYVDAKRQCNESTATITADSLAKSLRESAAKLRQKHGGKAVDFDVVIKDGKAVLKPVVRS